MPPSSRPLLLPPLQKAKIAKKEEPSPWFCRPSDEYAPCVSPGAATLPCHKVRAHMQRKIAWMHCAHGLHAHTDFIWAHLSNAKLRHEPSRWWISLLPLALNCPTPIALQLNQSCFPGKLHEETCTHTQSTQGFWYSMSLCPCAKEDFESSWQLNVTT